MQKLMLCCIQTDLYLLRPCRHNGTKINTLSNAKTQIMIEDKPLCNILDKTQLISDKIKLTDTFKFDRIHNYDKIAILTTIYWLFIN